MNEGRSKFSKVTYERQEVDDVAIIGAGIAGCYAAWRLRHSNLKITLYEYSDRIGGRCHTVKFPDIPDINVELGAMRFNPLDHRLLNAAISELGLEVIDFLPENTSTMYYLRGKHIPAHQLPDLAPYKLKPEHRKQPEKVNWDIFKEFTNVNTSEKGYRDVPCILEYTTPDGVPLYQQSHESFMGKFLYPEVSSYLQDTSGSVSMYQDVSAAKSIPVKNPDCTTSNTSYNSASKNIQIKEPDCTTSNTSFNSASKSIPVREADCTTSSAPYKTVKGGLQTVPESMVKQFLDSSKRHSYKSNCHLKSINKQLDGIYILTFQPTKTLRGRTKELTCDGIQIIAKAVFLAIPRVALERLELSSLKEPTIADYIKNSLYEAYATKIYFSYDDPWWRTSEKASSVVYSTTPLRLTNDFGISKISRRAVLNASFTDLNTTIWKNAVTQGEPVSGLGDDTIQMTDTAQNMTCKFLAEIYGMSEYDVPKPKCSAMRIWDEYPFGASWYYFRPGYVWTEVAEKMLKPSKEDEVYIISNTFSGTCQQAWLEGALEIVDNMLKKYFQNMK